MRIAYLILTHNTPQHFKRLVRALDSPNAEFFIHVDRKFSIAPFCDGLDRPNITFLRKRVPVYWGDFSDVAATIELIRAALTQTLKPDYLVLLSGSDYPLRTPGYIEHLFSRNLGQEFINLVRMPCDVIGKPLDRLYCYWLQTPQVNPFFTRAVARLNYLVNDRLQLVRRDYKAALKELLPYAGSQWWALTGPACQLILDFIEARPEVVKFLKYVYMPDESFFHTIIGNSEFANRVRRNLTFTDWSRPNGGPALIDLDHIRIFLKPDGLMANDVYGRGELLFARKFPDDSSHLTALIDTQLINRDRPTYCARPVGSSPENA